MQELTYISSRNNPCVKKYAKLSDKKYCESEQLFLIEGIKLFEEVIECGIPLEAVLFLEEKINNFRIIQAYNKAREKNEFSNVDFYCLSESAFSKISSEKAPEGVICVAKTLDNLNFYNKIDRNNLLEYEDEKIMMLFSLRDPGNVGTVIRSALAFGFDRIIMSSDSANLYNVRTVRAAMGALFKIKIDIVSDFISAIETIKDSGRRVFCAELRENAKSLDDIDVKKSDCFIIGNEGHGIPPEVSKKCTGSVYIPISKNSESLNAAIAASVIAFVQK